VNWGEGGVREVHGRGGPEARCIGDRVRGEEVAADAERRFVKREEKNRSEGGKNGKKKMTDARSER
jgi:hypothetical protein